MKGSSAGFSCGNYFGLFDILFAMDNVIVTPHVAFLSRQLVLEPKVRTA